MYGPSDQLIVLITYQAAGAFFRRFDFPCLGPPGGAKTKKKKKRISDFESNQIRLARFDLVLIIKRKMEEGKKLGWVVR